MQTPGTTASLRDFARKHCSILESLIPGRDSGTWGARLRNWLTDCALSRQDALCPSALETAVIDLVTLELACQSYALVDGELRPTDLGGTLWVRLALADLLVLLGKAHPQTARRLAVLARSSRDDRLGEISALIDART